MGRAVQTLLLLVALATPAASACPPDCVPGGGPAANDCLVQFGGIPASTTTCTDGNPACDVDGTIDGVCTFGLTACVGVATTTCTPAALTVPVRVGPAASPVARALQGALAALGTQSAACTAPGLAVPVRASFAGVAAGVARLTILARAGARHDRDRLTLTCNPAAAGPSLAVVQPILTARCAVVGCHQGTPPTSEPTLEDGRTHDAVVAVASTNVPSLRIVAPGDIAGSYLARKILGKRIVDHTSRMPLGCPKTPPASGCLTPGEVATILAWIQAGAR